MTPYSQLLLLTLASVVVALAPLATSVIRETFIHFDVVKGDYQDLYDGLKAALSDYPSRLEIEGHLVLAPQRRNKKLPPEHRIYLKLTGQDNDEATLFIADDNLYIYGFSNKSNDWFMLKDYNFFPNGQELDIGVEYKELIDGGIDSLPTVPLGRQSMIHAVHALSWHNPRMGDPTIVRRQMQLGLCRMVLMVSESTRFSCIRDSFAPNFDQESFATDNEYTLLHIWGKTSNAILEWNKCHCWESRYVEEIKTRSRYQITDAATAFEKTDVLLRKLN